MTVELTALGTHFAEGLELIESKAFNMLEGADLLVHLFNKQNLPGVILRADDELALVQIGESRWWLGRRSSGRWVVRGQEGAAGHHA